MSDNQPTTNTLTRDEQRAQLLDGDDDALAQKVKAAETKRRANDAK